MTGHPWDSLPRDSMGGQIRALVRQREERDARMSLTVYGVDGKPKPVAEAKPQPCVEPHCWHLSSEQHTVPNHSDWTCCLCAERHCVRAHPPTKDGWGHGPHAGSAAEKGCGSVLGRVVLP